MKFNLVGFVTSMVLGALMLSSSGNLHAGWGILHGGSSGGGSSGYSSVGASSGGYTASYGSSGYYGGSSGYVAAYSSYGGGSSGGSSGGPGLLQRFAGRIHDHMAAKRARHAARRAYYGSSGYGSSGGGSSGYSTVASYGSSGGGVAYSGGSSGGYASSVSYGSTGYSSAVSYGSTGYSSGANYGSTGYSAGYGSVDHYHGASNVQANQETAALVSNVQSEAMEDAVYLTVAVPADAKVFVNDNQTSSTGVVRKFVSRGLKSGKQYRFEVRAEMTAADGQLMAEEKTLVVSAGDEQQVQFAFAEQDSPIETAITLNLPEGAKVVLAGNSTQATGETRTYRTQRLKTGELWDDYEIEVEYEGNVKRQSIRLVGGDKLQLTFDFEQADTKIASR